MSGMPALGRPVHDGGCGFDYRLGMGIPDQWMRLVKDVRDENWSMKGLVSSLCNRRYTEKTVAYVESHDQSLVGDQTLGAHLTLVYQQQASVQLSAYYPARQDYHSEKSANTRSCPAALKEMQTRPDPACAWVDLSCSSASLVFVNALDCIHISAIIGPSVFNSKGHCKRQFRLRNSVPRAMIRGHAGGLAAMVEGFPGAPHCVCQQQGSVQVAAYDIARHTAAV